MLISSKHYSLEHLFKGATPLDHGVIVLSSSSYFGFHINHKLPLTWITLVKIAGFYQILKRFLHYKPICDGLPRVLHVFDG